LAEGRLASVGGYDLDPGGLLPDALAVEKYLAKQVIEKRRSAEQDPDEDPPVAVSVGAQQAAQQVAPDQVIGKDDRTIDDPGQESLEETREEKIHLDIEAGVQFYF